MRPQILSLFLVLVGIGLGVFLNQLLPDGGMIFLVVGGIILFAIQLNLVRRRYHCLTCEKKFFTISKMLDHADDNKGHIVSISSAPHTEIALIGDDVQLRSKAQ